jgi:putative membrane-bound dehydrogenase-like protein
MPAHLEPRIYQVGVAQIDITPAYPVRLSGFGFRRTESEGVTHPIWAKALAIDDGKNGPAVLITTDNLGVPDQLVNEVAGRLQKGAGLKRERLSVTATHTHTAPMLKGVAPTLFGLPIPDDHQKHIDRYTREFTDKLEQVALDALQNRAPARLAWGIGSVGFAKNRRTAGGPVDHDLPMLVVRDLNGKLRAVYVSYACHCVTLSNNKISGDWAGYAQEMIQRNHPQAIALISIGCGADANPSSGVARARTDLAAEQGAEIAREMERLLGNYLAPLAGDLTTNMSHFDLPLADLPTRQQWQERVQRGGAIGYHARVQLARLDRGEELLSKVPYSVQTWSFGRQLAMVFLPGEVVVDYALRLKRELDPGRLWINAYANDAPCYIPSERVLREGGYEGGDAMIYYDKPARFRPGLEQRIGDAVRGQLHEAFQAPYDAGRLQGTRPRSPQQSLATIQTRNRLTVELMAAEPLVASPVAIAFGPDGRLWVAEMVDYPKGIDGRFKPGGRIKILESSKGDGHYDRCKVFLDGLPFPTGITVWRKGVLICAAPDIIYAEDSKRDGKADVVRKLFSGFATHNYQARVNSLVYGLDNWVYGAGGIFGGDIKSFAGGPVHHLKNRDFRINPDSGAVEAAEGRAQQGRVRDDWGNWFGCDNMNLVRHYPLAEHYLRRNPYVISPPNDLYVPDYPDSSLLFPIKNDVQLFKLSGPPRRVTAACGIGIYRDDLLGKEFTGNSFTCEPVNLLVHRLVLQPKGVTFSGRRASDETQSEFLAGSDNWFRPVQAVTGPDGALWVVDMYRLVIEHPQWIPPEDLAKLDVRAGHTQGRIYRIYAKDRKPRPMLRLDQLDTAGLVAALDSPNGSQRDMAQAMLVWKQDKSAAASLEKMALTNPRPEARLHALCALDGLRSLKRDIASQALKDKHAGVRRTAVRLWERPPPGMRASSRVALLDDDLDPQVQLQLAYSGFAGGAFLVKHQDDPYLLAAALSAVNQDNIGGFVASALANYPGNNPPQKVVAPLLSLAALFGDRRALDYLLTTITPPQAAWHLDAVAEMLDAIDRDKHENALSERQRKWVESFFERARSLLADPKAEEDKRLAALRLLARRFQSGPAPIPLLTAQLVPQNSAAVQSAIVAALGRLDDDQVPHELLNRWATITPALRAQSLDVLFSRQRWLRLLVDSMGKGQVPANQLDAARRQMLLQHKEASIREAAARLFAGATNPDRKKVLDEFRAVTEMIGDHSRGKAVFAKRCATCHQLEGVGFAVGPDLASMNNKSPAVLLIAILDPNQAVDNRYLQYLAATRDGRIHNGILVSENSNTVTLKEQEGKEKVLLRSELEELRSTGKSLMPEGLEKDLTRQDLADVIAYLRVSGPPRKELAGNKPIFVKPAADGSITLPATAAEIYGGDITFEQPFQNIGCWHGEHDFAAWTVEMDRDAKYEVYLDYACHDSVAGNAFVLEGGEPALHARAGGTGGWDKYRQIKIGTLALKAGTRRIVLRPNEPITGALLDLRAIRLVIATK